MSSLHLFPSCGRPRNTHKMPARPDLLGVFCRFLDGRSVGRRKGRKQRPSSEKPGYPEGWPDPGSRTKPSPAFASLVFPKPQRHRSRCLTGNSPRVGRFRNVHGRPATAKQRSTLPAAQCRKLRHVSQELGYTCGGNCLPEGRLCFSRTVCLLEIHFAEVFAQSCPLLLRLVVSCASEQIKQLEN